MILASRRSSLSLPSHENLAKEAKTSARCVVDGLLNMAIKKPCHLRLPPQPPWPKNRVLCTPPNRTGPSWFIEGRGAHLRIHGPICRCASLVACFSVPKLSPGSKKFRSLEKFTLKFFLKFKFERYDFTHCGNWELKNYYQVSTPLLPRWPWPWAMAASAAWTVGVRDKQRHLRRPRGSGQRPLGAVGAGDATATEEGEKRLPIWPDHGERS